MPWAGGTALALTLLLAGQAQAQEQRAQAPSPSLIRYDEDWSVLSDGRLRTGRWTEAFKYAPLSVNGPAYLTTGLELRLRNEDIWNNGWGAAPAPDDGYLWARALPYADLHVGKVRAFVQPMVAYAVGVAPAPGPVDRSGADLLQAFGEVRQPVGDAVLTIRAGRQMMPLGTERLVGTRYGPNVPLAFDGARAEIALGAGTLSLLSVKPVSPGPGAFDDRSSRTKSLWGAYATLPGLDLYYLGYRNHAASFGGVGGEERRHSLGLRSHGQYQDWRWNVEGVVQFGRFGAQSIRAWTLGSEVSRQWATAPLAPKLLVRFNMISGDKTGADRRLGTFNALFPKGKYFGELSPVGPYNIVNLSPAVSVALSPRLTVTVNGMAYWRYALGDGIYDVPGNLVRAAGGSRSRFIGKEVEAVAVFEATPELELSTSLSAFEPGAFIQDTGPAHTIAMLGVEANFRF